MDAMADEDASVTATATIPASARRPSASRRALVRNIFGLSPNTVLSLWDKLTRQEQRIAECYARGQRSRAIAQALDISIKTLDIHRANICAKLGDTRAWGIGQFYFAAKFLGIVGGD